MDEQDLLKRNTDCVYFLASPLTCKKGIDCEYRHSEIARINPRDCWYWLAGNCLNPTCAFRHPPLDGHTGLLSEPSLPLKKTKAPCYFFFNGFCNKGDRCSFLHGPDESASAVKSSMTDCASTVPLILERKTSAACDRGSASAPAEKLQSPDSSKVASDSNFDCQEDFQLQVPMQKSFAMEISVPKHEDVASFSGSLLPEESLGHSISDMCNVHGLEEEMYNYAEPKKRWESSPGFDVLLDSKANNMDCQDDLEFVETLDEEGSELNEPFLGYNSEYPDEHNTIPEAGHRSEHEIYNNNYGFQGSKNLFGRVRKLSAEPRGIILESMCTKRKCLPITSTGCDRSRDPRHYLKRRKHYNVCITVGLARRPEYSSFFMVRNQGRRQQQCHGMDQQPQRKLMPKVGIGVSGFRSSQKYWSRKYRMKGRLGRQHFPSDAVSRKWVSRERKSIQKSIPFRGPKTLAHIKEEKQAEGANDQKLPDFQDPKPLSEILKDKRRLDYARDGNATSN